MALRFKEYGGVSPFRVVEHLQSIGVTWLTEEELANFWGRLPEPARAEVLLDLVRTLSQQSA